MEAHIAAAPVYGKVKAKIGSEIDKQNPPHLSNYPYPILVANDSQDAGEVYAIVKAMVEHYDDYKNAAKGALGWLASRICNGQCRIDGAVKYCRGRYVECSCTKHRDMLVAARSHQEGLGRYVRKG